MPRMELHGAGGVHYPIRGSSGPRQLHQAARAGGALDPRIRRSRATSAMAARSLGTTSSAV
jgi:hypothetical protein